MRVAVLLALLVALPASGQIATDRPGLGLSPSTVDRGTIQVELAVPQASLVDLPLGASVTTFTAPLALRYGASETVELRASTSLYRIVRADGGSLTGGTSTDGEVDLDVVTVGAKVQLATNGPVVALVPEVSVSTTEAGSVSGAVLAVAGWTLTDVLGLTTVLGATLADGDPDVVVTGEAVAVLGASLSDALGVYAELGAFPTEGATPLLGGGGVTLLLSPDLQFDASIDVGLNDEAAALLFGAGVAARF